MYNDTRQCVTHRLWQEVEALARQPSILTALMPSWNIYIKIKYSEQEFTCWPAPTSLPNMYVIPEAPSHWPDMLMSENVSNGWQSVTLKQQREPVILWILQTSHRASISPAPVLRFDFKSEGESATNVQSWKKRAWSNFLYSSSIVLKGRVHPKMNMYISGASQQSSILLKNWSRRGCVQCPREAPRSQIDLKRPHTKVPARTPSWSECRRSTIFTRSTHSRSCKYCLFQWIQDVLETWIALMLSTSTSVV